MGLFYTMISGLQVVFVKPFQTNSARWLCILLLLFFKELFLPTRVDWLFSMGFREKWRWKTEFYSSQSKPWLKEKLLSHHLSRYCTVCKCKTVAFFVEWIKQAFISIMNSCLPFCITDIRKQFFFLSLFQFCDITTTAWFIRSLFCAFTLFCIQSPKTKIHNWLWGQTNNIFLYVYISMFCWFVFKPDPRSTHTHTHFIRMSRLFVDLSYLK